MSLHGLLSVTIGVPNVEETAAYYAEFGLTPGADGWFSTVDAGRQLRMVEVREGVWTRPQNLPRAAAPGEAWTQADAQCTWWTARPDAEGAAFAAGLFEKDAWAERAAMFVGHLDGSIANVRTGAGPAIADAFVVGAAALAHVRADPLLPAELCGPDWPGDALRVAYRNFQRAFSDAVREWFRNR